MRLGLLLATMCLCVPALSFAQLSPPPLVTVEEAESSEGEGPEDDGEAVELGELLGGLVGGEVVEPAPLEPPPESWPGQPSTLESVFPGHTPHLGTIERDEPPSGAMHVERYWLPLLAGDAAVLLTFFLLPQAGVFGYLLVSPVIHVIAQENYLGAGLSFVTRLLLPIATASIGTGLELAAGSRGMEAGLAGFIIGAFVGYLASLVIDYVFFAKVEVPDQVGPRMPRAWRSAPFNY